MKVLCVVDDRSLFIWHHDSQFIQMPTTVRFIKRLTTVLCRCRARFALHRHKKTWWKRCCWHSNSAQYRTRGTRIAKLQQITSGTAKGSTAATHWEQIGEKDTSNELPAERTAETIAFSPESSGTGTICFRSPPDQDMPPSWWACRKILVAGHPCSWMYQHLWAFGD